MESELPSETHVEADRASLVRVSPVAATEHNIAFALISADALNICQRLQEAGFQAYLVGGCVRDLLLGREPKDFDISTDAHPHEIRELFRRSRIVGRRFQIVHVRSGREIIEVTTFRGHHEHEPDTEEDDFPLEADRDSKQYADTGMLLRDNVFGTLEEDALRRDFTVNALYYDPSSQVLLNFHDGLQDLQRQLLRVIGTPDQRYQEDPVRMLRAARFAAKLGFHLDEEAEAAIGRQRHLLHQVAAARLFDEVLKLLLGGYGARTFDLLVKYELLEFLAPDVAESLDIDPTEREFIVQALANSDQRIADDKPVTPAFLYASLLWPALVRRQEEIADQERIPLNGALRTAIPEIIADQAMCTTIPKRFSAPMREIWELQPKLVGRRQPGRTAAHPRFRAAYDFVLLREQVGEDLDGAGAWWTRYQEEHPISSVTTPEQSDEKPRGRPRRRRRRRSKHSGNDAN